MAVSGTTGSGRRRMIHASILVKRNWARQVFDALTKGLLPD